MKKAQLTLLALAFFILSAGSLFATSTPPPPPPTNQYPITIPNPLKTGSDSLAEFINDVIENVIVPVGGTIAVIFIIYSGFLFVTAQGNETKLATAKRAFLYAAVGTLILLGAWAISEAIKGTITELTTG